MEIILPDFANLIFALVGVVVGALIAGVATWRAAEMMASTTLEAEKYRQRLDAYQKLWSSTQALRRTPEEQDLTPESLATVVDALDSWYFRTGGLLLTDEARAAYFNLIDCLKDGSWKDGEPISRVDYAPVLRAATRLRDITATEVRGKEKTKYTSRGAIVSTVPDVI